jgi:hypothetical protein
MWGAYEIIHEFPSLTEARNVVALPYLPGGAWGIFNSAGRCLMDAIDRHGPDGRSADRQLVAPVSLLRSANHSQHETYVYGGFVNLHFGHFIANTLPRLWPIILNMHVQHTFLFHGQGTPADWFNFIFIRDLLGALGINSGNVEFVDRPTRISRLIIPHPSFQEQHFVHSVFGKLCRKIGDKLAITDDSTQKINTTPVYLTKTGLTSGVGHFVNEGEVVDRLQSSGIEIFYPEKMAPADQIDLFRSRRIIFGPLGSAFHNSIFCKANSKVICLAPNSHPNSNFMMFDSLSGVDAQYYYDPGTIAVDSKGKDFLTSLRLSDPERIASDLLRLVQ